MNTSSAGIGTPHSVGGTVSLFALGSRQLKRFGEQLMSMKERSKVDGQQSPSS
jgi:hypothetical protein